MNKKRLTLLLLTLVFLLALVGCKGKYAAIKTTSKGQGSIELEPQQKAYKKGSKVKITAKPDQNWEFANWSGDLTGHKKTHQIVIEEDMSIKASFKQESVMFRGDLANTGASNGPGVNSSKLKWEFGSQKYKAVTGSAPAVTEDLVYVGTKTGLSALNIETGKETWSIETNKNVFSVPAVVGDTIYFGSVDKYFYAVDRRTGKIKWKFKAEHWIESSPAVTDKAVYFGSFDNHFYAVDAESGAEEWSFKAKARIASSAAVKDKAVWFGDLKGNIYVLKAETGKKKKDFKLQYTSPVISSPLAVGQKVYFGRGNVIAEVDVKTGDQTWLFNIESQILSSLVLKDGVIYFADNKGHLYALGKEESNQQQVKSK